MQRSRVVLSLGVALGALALATHSPASDLRGTLQDVSALSPSARQDPAHFRASYWEVPNGVLPLSAQHASVEFDVGVILTGPGIAESTQPVGVRVEGGRCRPGTVVVSPGTMLDITNADVLGHELYAVARGATERVVPAELTSPRARRQMQFTQAGVYEVRDARQPSFRCWVIVGPGQGRILLPGSTGAFAATGLSDGDYTVKVYFEGVERSSQPALIRGHELQMQIALGGGGAPAAPAAPAGNQENARHHGER